VTHLAIQAGREASNLARSMCAEPSRTPVDDEVRWCIDGYEGQSIEGESHTDWPGDRSFESLP
jgi:hypothetical protein